MSVQSGWMNESKRADKKRQQNMKKQKEDHAKKMKKLLNKKETNV